MYQVYMPNNLLPIISYMYGYSPETIDFFLIFFSALLFLFDADKFFSRYSFSIRRGDPRNPSSDRFSCQIYLKVWWGCLLRLFLCNLTCTGRPFFQCLRGELLIRGTKTQRLNGVKWTSLILPINDQAECRLVIKMLCGKGNGGW